MKKETRYKTLYFLAVVIASMLFLPALSASILVVASGTNQETTVTYTFSFTQPTIQRSHDGYDRVSIQNLISSADQGKPVLPVKNIVIPLPRHMKVKNVYVSGNLVYLGEGYRVEPGKSLYFSVEPLQDSSIQPDEAIYGSNNAYPENPLLNGNTYSFRGYALYIGTAYPVVYYPQTGKIYYYTDLLISITVISDNTENALYRGLEKDASAFEEKMDSSDISLPPLEPPENGPLTENTYDLLILTTDALKSGFVPLAEKHNATGIRTQIKTLTDVGGNTPEAIRNFIRSEYLTKGIEYVILGGDADVIPAKGLYAVVKYNQQIIREDTNLPSDLYYACLDGTFDGNGNGTFGEQDDNVDLVAEVYVGRACVSTLTEVQYFVTKTITYIDSGIASGGKYIGRVVLAGEKLWDDPLTYGDTSLEELVDGSNDNGTTTVGIPLNKFAITRLYESDGSWSKSEVTDRINNGIYILDNLGHGSISQMAKITITDVTALINSKLCFIYSQACNSGRFDDSSQDSIAEYLTIKSDQAAFAVIMNTREGWYTQGSPDGPSHRYNRQFWDSIFNDGITDQRMLQFGVANQDSKEDNIYRINEEAMRWCYYEITFFGDPTLKIYEPIPQPVLNIGTITGGWGIHTSVKNTGNLDANTVTWTVNVKGGVLQLMNKTFDNSFGSLLINDNESINTRPFLGLGRIKITIKTNFSGDIPIKRTKTMFIFGAYIFEPPALLQRFFNR